MSAHLKFGTISIREMYRYIVATFRGKHDNPLVRELVFRSFYTKMCIANPRMERDQSFRQDIDKQIPWLSHKDQNYVKYWKAWTEGKTGFPLADAGMRQLNDTGYMHNRARLIVASFLTKTMLISWKEGEEFFAKKLTDYDPASNNGNWQWTASTGADSQPYFRIFNPWEQAKNFDPDCEYIKKWVPELKDVPVKDIFNWETQWINHKETNYPKPICNYEKQREFALKMFNQLFH